MQVVENTDVSHYPRNIIVPVGNKKKYEDIKSKNSGEEEIKSQKNSEKEM